MSYKLKTLIVFDSNSLRSTDAGDVAYSFFAFGKPFQVIESFLIEKNLTDDVHLAIPTWAIEEIKDQKSRKYKEDVDDYLKITTRLMGLPGFGKIPLPVDNFDCAAYIEEKAKEFISGKQIKLLEIKEEAAHTILKRMMTRVMKDENKKQPFAHSGKYKDAGFKDNIIWESFMRFEGIKDYDKVIFITKDGDYKNCDVEFKDKWERHISILKDENNAIVELTKDYGNYIQERAIYDFAQTDYFKDYLYDELKVKSSIVVEGAEYAIENFSITDTCQKADRQLPNEEGVENILVVSEIKIFYTVKGEKKEQIIEGLTLLWDDITKEIVSTEFDFEIR